MEKGIIVKKFGGFYFVYNEGTVIRCTHRGKHRLDKKDVYPGDYVELSVLPHEEGVQGVIEHVLPRKNLLRRPLVANVTQLICVTAVKSPEPNYFLLDKLLVCAELNDLQVVVCFNKKDIPSPDREDAVRKYARIGYRVIMTSALTGEGVNDLKELLAGHLSVFAGQSGVGKSSLLNLLKPEAEMEVGEISGKLKAGRHTTKHVELFSLDKGGFVADTPGFSRIDIPPMVREELGEYFPEIRELRAKCRFNTCLHDQEPGCAVTEAVETGQVDALRYRSYITLLKEVIARERSF
ncbi:MAG: ribosome small subunit-dependent GTPase A [Bacillota bacterium]|jgi:ribosome biogenesis GTPase